MFLKSIWVWVSTVLYPPELVPAPANNTIRVIGVGLSRTGTLSTRLALSRLLGGKIYHGYESDMDDRADFWLRSVVLLLLYPRCFLSGNISPSDNKYPIR